VKWVGKIARGIVLVALLALAAAWLWMRQSLPTIDGEAQAKGLAAPVEIVRDAEGVPHIFAKSERDGAFALGYAHAQDRLWQMEFQRRVGMGRLSEILGPPTINVDRFLRTLGTGRAARSAWASLAPQSKDQINAYVAGVNAFISTHHGSALPPEFTLLRFEPEPFTGEGQASTPIEKTAPFTRGQKVIEYIRLNRK
jgi:penicillin amidase